MQYKHIGEVRAKEQSRNIYGKAITFETESTALPFVEIIHRGAITEDTIKKSNIIFNYNHNRDELLARSYMGEGTLHITVKDDGVYFDFDAPETRFGDEILNLIRRGDLMKCSFCFSVSKDVDAVVRGVRDDGRQQIDIYKIEELYDLSVVVDPAYEDTYISARKAEFEEDKNIQNTDMTNENKIKELEEQIKQLRAADDEKEKEEQELKEEEEKTDADEKEVEVDKVEEEQDKEEIENDEKEEERECVDEKSEKEERNTKISIDKKMEKQFSLLRAIRSIANNQTLDPVDEAVVKAGANQFRKSGVEFGGQIQLPNMIETRSAITVTAEGEDVVATDIYDILEPLRAKNVLVQAGAKFMTGLVGNVQVPVMSASNVGWELETANASDGAGSFSHITLSPHRLTAYLDISKQFLVQDGIGAEAVIREDLVKAINSKLEETILGTADGKDGSNNQVAPAGIFNGATLVDVEDFGDVCDLEATVEDANVIGECKYIMDAKAKAVLRKMVKGTNANAGMVFEAGEVDGTPALITSNVPDNYVAYGDWSNLAIGQWGAIDLTVDPYTVATAGKVRLVINAFFDAKVLRSAAFAYGDTDPNASSSN